MNTVVTKKKPTVLYVDDEEHNLQSFVATFRRYYTIFTETSPKSAMEILKNNEVNLVITDQRMPEMSGVDFLKIVKKDFPDTVRMVLTGFSDVSAIIGSINDGSVLSYVTKPWNEKEFKELIDIALRIQSYEKHNNELQKNLQETINKQKITINLLQKYVPNETIGHIINEMNNNAQSSLYDIKNIKQCTISVLFSDIRAFTKIAETLNPKQLLTYLNNYFTVMVSCVNKNHGIVYKFLGDGLMVLFGTKESSENHQKNAIQCTLDMIEALQILNESLIKEYNHQIIIGIGIKTGEVIICHAESENFLSYTVIGEPVDEVVQLEHIAHDIPNGILIDEKTYQIIKNENLKNVTYQKLSDNQDIHQVIFKKHDKNKTGFSHGMTMTKRATSYQEYLIDSLSDHEEAAGYLNAALKGGDIHVFLMALQNVIRARGGISKLAKKTHKSRTSLYKSLSLKGNPYLKNTNEILDAIGMTFQIVEISSKRRGRKATRTS